MINIRITTFKNPFSFFCMTEDINGNDNSLFDNNNEIDNVLTNKNKVTDVNHGQYVAVMWNSKWARGIVSMETQFLIWLIDYGIYLRPNDKTVFIDLPLEYRKFPSKVFEASIHGVVPIDKVLSDDCQIKNGITTSWTQGAIEKCQNLIKSASKFYMLPKALLSTKHNDVVIGDLFLEIPGIGIINVSDELEKWPVFLEKNKEAYIKNFSKYYTSRRHHRTCQLKPDIPDFTSPTISTQISLQEYVKIIENSPIPESFFKEESVSEDGSSLVSIYDYNKKVTTHKISPSDIEKYSNSYITLNGEEYNILSILINKARDLNICDRYKDHDLKSVGRGFSFKSSFINDFI